MQLEHSFDVPISIEEAFEVLTDLERISPCMPGATLDDVDGDDYHGHVKVKVGPMQMTYRGTARFTERDPDSHHAVIEARGTEARGAGTAQATITAHLERRESGTQVTVVTDLQVTGRPAQFGRGVMADVGDKLLGQFADCLARELEGGDVLTVSDNGEGKMEASAAPGGAEQDVAAEGAPASTGGAPSGPEPMPGGGGGAATTAAAQPAPRAPARGAGSSQPAPPARPTSDTIDLVEVAGGSVLRRAAPVVAALALIALIIWFVRRSD